jgi:hypothetical protein
MKMLFLVIVVILATFSTDVFAQCGQASAQSADENRLALLVGVENYNGTNISKLSGPSKDVYSLKKALVDCAGFKPNNVVVLVSNPQTSASADGQSETDLVPTSANIIEALADLKNRMIDPHSLILIMFSGHGMVKDDKGYLLTEDSRNDGNTKVLAKTSVPITDINEFVAEASPAQVIILLDSCRNDPDATSHDPAPNVLKSKGFVDEFTFSKQNSKIIGALTFYATSVGHRAWTDSNGNGFFTQALVDGIRGKASNDGLVTVSKLVAYTSQTVPGLAAKGHPDRDEQKPFPVQDGDIYDLVLARTDKPIGAVPDALVQATQATSPKLADSFKVVPSPASAPMGPTGQGSVSKLLCSVTAIARHEKKQGTLSTQVCALPRPDLLDASYRMSEFSCCSDDPENAGKEVSLADIPAGIELKIDASTGQHYVTAPIIDTTAKTLKIAAFCAPPHTLWHYQCYASVDVIAHYREDPKD